MKEQRVMIIGDVSVVMPDLVSQVTHYGYSIFSMSPDGDEAKNLQAADIPDIALIVLGPMDAQDGIRTGQYLHLLYDIPVVYLAEPGQQEVFDKVMDAGPLGYLEKPIHGHDLQAALAIALTVRDEVETRKMDHEAIRTQKLEPLGLMVRGLAHDFNNILSSVLANIQLTRMELPEGGPAYTRLSHVEDSVLRARELSQQMLTYSGSGSPEAKRSDVSGIIRSAASLTLRESKSKCEFDLPDGQWEVPMDEDLIRLILNDLFRFMVGSMNEGGTIRVSLENIIAGTAESVPNAPVNYLLIRLSTPEFVIPEGALEDLFKPEFSMAFALNLSFAESMSRKSGGVLDIKSDEGSGTELLLYLPASYHPANIAEPRKKSEPQKPEKPGLKKILLMDDEEAILSATGEMLKFLGYEVATAQNGESAVDLFRDARDAGVPFDAVILDITIPGGLGAKETLPKLVEIDPAVLAIISSGYSTNPMIVDCHSFGFAAAIVKPYGFKELGEALDTVFG
jgi:DNA-binding NarL/FixJ family response regulator